MTNINFIEFKPSKYNMKYMKGLYKLCNESIPDYAIEMYNENLFDINLIEKYELSHRDIELLNYMIAFKNNIIVLSISIPDNVNKAYIDHKILHNTSYKNVMVIPNDFNIDYDKSRDISDIDHLGDEIVGIYRYGLDTNNIIPLVMSSGMNIDITWYANGPIDIPSTIKQLYYKKAIVFSSTPFYDKPFSKIMMNMYSGLLPYVFETRDDLFFNDIKRLGNNISNEYIKNENRDPDHLLGLGIFIY